MKHFEVNGSMISIDERYREINSRTQMILTMEDQLRGLSRKFYSIVPLSGSEKHQKQTLLKDMNDLRQQIIQEKEYVKKLKNHNICIKSSYGVYIIDVRTP